MLHRYGVGVGSGPGFGRRCLMSWSRAWCFSLVVGVGRMRETLPVWGIWQEQREWESIIKLWEWLDFAIRSALETANHLD